MLTKTRFAPSPTGYVHIGSLRTVLYNYLWAKKQQGIFALRVEDTDQKRYVEGSVENLFAILKKMGMEPDESAQKDLGNGPYFQSQRLDIYKKYIQHLLDNETAYYCFCSSQRLDELRTQQQEMSLPTRYDGHCRHLTKEEIQEQLQLKTPYTIRLKVPKNQKIIVKDIVKGKLEWNSNDIDDQVLMKSDGFPTYHFANIVDDYLMKVTHVIRWDEWTPSLPKHVLLYQAFGWKMPEFAHIPLLLGSDKKKLSKRTGDVSVESYIERWFLKEAILNYIALLGWNPKTNDELFTLEELIDRFDIHDVHKSWAIFDVEKLEWMNNKYLNHKLSSQEVYDRLVEYIQEYQHNFYMHVFQKFDTSYHLKIISELKGRLRTFEEYKDLTHFFYSHAKINTDLLVNEKMKILTLQDAKESLEFTLSILDEIQDKSSIDEIKEIFIPKIKEAGKKNGQVLWPVRVALSGEPFSPGAFEMISILWNEMSRDRIQKVLDNIT